MSITILIYGNTDEQNRSIAIITAIIIKKKIQSKKKKQQQQKRSIFSHITVDIAHYIAVIFTFYYSLGALNLKRFKQVIGLQRYNLQN